MPPLYGSAIETQSGMKRRYPADVCRYFGWTYVPMCVRSIIRKASSKSGLVALRDDIQMRT